MSTWAASSNVILILSAHKILLRTLYLAIGLCWDLQHQQVYLASLEARRLETVLLIIYRCFIAIRYLLISS